MNTSIKTITKTVPACWLIPLMYGDTSGLEESELASLTAYMDRMVIELGACWPVGSEEIDLDNQTVKVTFQA